MRNPSIILAVVAMTMASSAKAQTAFSDDQIRSALVGNTISGQESGEYYEMCIRDRCKRTRRLLAVTCLVKDLSLTIAWWGENCDEWYRYFQCGATANLRADAR